MAKKEMQIDMNNLVLAYEGKALEIWNKNNHGKGKRLNSMQAWVYTIGNYHFLVSYKTLVAFIIDNGTGVDIMREREFYKEFTVKYCGGSYTDFEYTNYSRSSARQISTFFRMYGAKQVLTYKPV